LSVDGRRDEFAARHSTSARRSALARGFPGGTRWAWAHGHGTH